MFLIKNMAGNEMEDSSTPLVDISEFLSSPLGVHDLQSSVPAVCLEEESFMGIDEAGRGPVLGNAPLILIYNAY